MLPNILKTFGLIAVAGVLVLVFYHLGLNDLLNVLITSAALGASLRYFIGQRAYLIATLAGLGAVLFYNSAFDLLQMMFASVLLGYSAVHMMQRYVESRKPARRLPLNPNREFLNY
jgi:predicted lysophospholipase L1 biosynthesis ABC-type transport system permease subunit